MRHPKKPPEKSGAMSSVQECCTTADAHRLQATYEATDLNARAATSTRKIMTRSHCPKQRRLCQIPRLRPWPSLLVLGMLRGKGSRESPAPELHPSHRKGPKRIAPAAAPKVMSVAPALTYKLTPGTNEGGGTPSDEAVIPRIIIQRPL